jgi:hypothetical protein
MADPLLSGLTFVAVATLLAVDVLITRRRHQVSL